MNDEPPKPATRDFEASLGVRLAEQTSYSPLERELFEKLSVAEARAAFLSELDHRVQPLAEPDEVMSVTAQLLAEHLGADRCAYAEVENESMFVITGDFTRDVPSIVGNWPVAAFGPECERQMLANEAYVVTDTDVDDRIGPEDLPAYRATTIRAVVCVPLHKQGRFTAAMAVHQKVPRVWTAAEIELVQTTVNRCWESLERTRAARVLRESEKKYRTLFDSMDECYCVIEMIFDDAGRPVDYVFLEANAAFETQTGWHNIAGKRMRELAPNHEQYWFDIYGKVAVTGEPIRFENPADVLNARWFSLYAFRIGAPGDHRVAVLFTDITERRNAEQSIRFQAHLLNTVEQSAIATDLDGIVTYWNRFAEKLYGWTAEEAIGRQIFELTTPEMMAGSAEEIMSQLRRGESWSGEFNVKRRDGCEFPAYVINSPIENDAGELIGIIGISVDITDRKRVEEELRRSRENLERCVQERTRELAATNIALHEENLERRKIEQERVGILQRLVTAQEDVRRRIGRDLHDQLGQHVTALRFKLETAAKMAADNPKVKEQISQAQDYARQVDADVGFLTFELRPTALDDLGLVAAIEIFVNEWSRNHKIHAEFYAGRVEEALPPEAEINIYRVLQEALNNTLKHAEANRVTVQLDFQKGNLVLIIEDDGVGFDPENMPVNTGSGNGLGLIGMRERCLLVGGNLEIESAPGKGTVIYARIPAITALNGASGK